METKDIPQAEPSLWVPMTNFRDIGLIVKTIEELGECASALSRCLIQGLLEEEPVTGKLNKEWLQEEMADVYAMLSLVEKFFELDTMIMHERYLAKREYKLKWLEALERQEDYR